MLPLSRRARRFPGLLLVLPLIFCLGLSPPRLRAAEEIKRSFALAAGRAEETLEAFSAQADAQVVFLLEDVRGATTPAIRGDFHVRDALERLVAGTGLGVTQDEKTGAFVVRRVRNADPIGRAPGNSNTPPSPLVKTSLPARFFAALAASVSSLATLQAQSAASSPPPPGKDDTITLSPFVVTTDKDSGYVATSTLAGTRIKTNLRDLGAAISVVTPEFMNDVGARNIEEVLTYTAGTEIGGPLGNYSAADGLNNLTGRPDLDGVRREPQSGARVRGLVAPNFTRQYFSTNIPGDGYNTGQITINRGANSLLFGLGSSSGVIDSGLNQAIIGRDGGEIVARYGAEDSVRSSFDYNLTLLPKRLAVRVDALYEQKNYRQRPAFDRERRIYAAVSAVLFENRNSRILGPTVVRANFEAGKIASTPPTSIAPTIGYAPFFLPPVDFRPYSGGDYTMGGGYDLLARNWRQWAVNDTRRLPGPTPGSFIPGWFEQLSTAEQFGRPELVAQNHSSSHIFTQIGLVFSPSGQSTVGIPGSNLQGFQGWIDGSPQYMANFINTRPYEETGGGTGFKAPTLTNPGVFDYRNLLLTGGLQDIDKKFDAHSVTLEQTFLSRMAGVELTFDKQYYRLDYFQPFGGGDRNLPVYIDTSLYLPDGTPNPNVGRAFLLQQGVSDQFRTTTRENGRATAFLDLDVRKWNQGWGRWLGRHVFTGLWQEEDRTVKGLNHALFHQGLNFDVNRSVGGARTDPAVRNQLSFNALAVLFAYVSDDLRGKQMNEVRLNPVALPRLRGGETFNTVLYDVNPQVTPAPNAWRPGATVLRRYTTGGTAGRTVVTSKALAWQSYLLGDSIVGLAGWRDDKIQNYRQVTTNARSLANEYLESNLLLRDTPATTQNGNTFTWSVVGHAPRRWVERLGPFVSSISGHYGVGENFSAIAERHDVTNARITNPSGETTEYGLTLGFAREKWALKINRFETSSLANGVLGGVTRTSITEAQRPLNNYRTAENRGVAFTALSDYAKLAAAGYTSYDQLYAAIKNFIPQPARGVYDYQLSPNSGLFELPSGGGIQGLSATSDVVAKGWEVELAGNPTSRWRVALNLVQVEAEQANSATALAALQNQYVANMRAAKLDNVVEGPLSTVTMFERYNGENVVPTVALRAKDGTLNQEIRKYRVNLVTNYDFGAERLKGFGVGGAVRWQSKVATGYATQLDANRQQVPLVNQPFWGPDEFNGDLWLGYKRKISQRIGWKIRLNLRNYIGSRDDIVVATNPDGRKAVFRIAPAREWFLTNTFTF